eukprot:812891-Amphidinium_carterae.1
MEPTPSELRFGPVQEYRDTPLHPPPHGYEPNAAGITFSTTVGGQPVQFEGSWLQFPTLYGTSNGVDQRKTPPTFITLAA